MDDAAKRAAARPLLDRSYWLTRPVAERLAIAERTGLPWQRPDRRRRSGLVGLARVLNATHIHYLVTGGYALAAHGLPRPTAGLNIWVEPSRTHLRAMLCALSDYGYGSLDLAEAHQNAEETRGRSHRLGHPPLRVDLCTRASGLHFAECHARRTELDIGGERLAFLCLTDLRANKLAAGRQLDLLDLDGIDAALAA